MLYKIKAKEGKGEQSEPNQRMRQKPKRNEGAQAAMLKKQTPLRVRTVDQCVQQEGV
jgi:hypothetical protein